MHTNSNVQRVIMQKILNKAISLFYKILSVPIFQIQTDLVIFMNEYLGVPVEKINLRVK